MELTQDVFAVTSLITATRPSLTPILIRKKAPDWAKKLVSLRNTLPSKSHYDAIVKLLNDKRVLFSTDENEGMRHISVPYTASRRVVFAFADSDGILTEVFETNIDDQ